MLSEIVDFVPKIFSVLRILLFIVQKFSSECSKCITKKNHKISNENAFFVEIPFIGISTKEMTFFFHSSAQTCQNVRKQNCVCLVNVEWCCFRQRQMNIIHGVVKCVCLNKA